MEQTTRPQTILVVEDDKDTRDLIKTILSRDGYEVETARDGKEGLEKALRILPDLILLDIMLPEMDGLAVCKNLMEDGAAKSIPVIILTAKQELSTKLSSFVAGAKRFISKPFEASEITDEVRRTLRQREIQSVAISSPMDPRD